MSDERPSDIPFPTSRCETCGKPILKVTATKWRHKRPQFRGKPWGHLPRPTRRLVEAT